MKPPERIFEKHARHRLRALGNEQRREDESQAQASDPCDDGERPFGKRPRDSASRAEQLLNFLSKSAAQYERALLSPTPVPDFARVKSSAVDEDVQPLVIRKRKRRTAAKIMAETTQESKPDSLLSMLAESIAEQALVCLPQTAKNSGLVNSGLKNASNDAVFASRGVAFASLDSVSTLKPERFLKDPSGSRDYSKAAPTNGSTAQSVTSADSLASAIVGTGTALFSARANATEYGGNRSLSEVYSDCMADLDTWLGFDASAAVVSEIEPGQFGPGLPAALPAIVPESDLVRNSEDSDGRLRSGELAVTLRERPEVREAALARRRNSRYKRFLFNKNVLWKPRMMTLPNGNRLERYSNGAELTKDVHGRVIDIRTAEGTSVQMHYDADGKPDSFIRLDARNQAHSLGERDSHGVVVRDPEGRVRAAGESMSVDPTGCVSVRRGDGQFWSIDLLRGVHIERRRVSDRENGAFLLTALFASDGFRMVTRFQNQTHGSTKPNCGKSFLADDFSASGSFRFYGRDGSLIEFESEEDLLELKPSRVCQPGTRAVEPAWRGYYQAGTAWESVQEYITSYLLA